MVQNILPPGMQTAEEADICAKVLHVVGRDLQQCGGAGAKQKIVNDFLIGQRESRKAHAES